MEPKIWRVSNPKLTIEDIFQAEGADYSKRSPRPSMLELRYKLLAEATELVQPIAAYTEVKVTGWEKDKLYLEGDHRLTSKLLTGVAGKSDQLVLFAMTIGSAFDDHVSSYSKTGKTVEAFILDAIGTAFISKSARDGLGELEKRYQNKNLKTTFPLGPGHSYWSSLEDIKVIFELLKPEHIGLNLTGSNLIMPRKSIAFVMGVGTELPDYHGKTHCDFCSLKSSCHMKQC